MPKTCPYWSHPLVPAIQTRASDENWGITLLRYISDLPLYSYLDCIISELEESDQDGKMAVVAYMAPVRFTEHHMTVLIDHHIATVISILLLHGFLTLILHLALVMMDLLPIDLNHLWITMKFFFDLHFVTLKIAIPYLTFYLAVTYSLLLLRIRRNDHYIRAAAQSNF